MRILLLDHHYGEFVRRWYRERPALAVASYAEQRASFESSLFGATTFEVAALRALGHEADVVIINTRPAQEAWAREHGIRLSPPDHLRLRLRRGVVPWLGRARDRRWMSEAVLAQVADYRPDVLHVQAMDTIDPRLISELRSMVRLVVGQIAAPLPLERALAGYQLVVSSLPNYVGRFREAGLDSEWLPLAFEPTIPNRLGPIDRTVAVSFVGSVMTSHSSRADLLEAVAGQVPVDVWTADAGRLSGSSPLRARLHPAVWGADMYRALGASRITINAHIDIAERYANNLRLYEATGMGALLVTDHKDNLGELFAVGREVVAYADADDCAEKVRYYVERPAEARIIAERGQERTLRDHTWRNRMERWLSFVEARL